MTQMKQKSTKQNKLQTTNYDTNARFLKRGVYLGLVNPRSEGYKKGKSRRKLA